MVWDTKRKHKSYFALFAFFFAGSPYLVRKEPIEIYMNQISKIAHAKGKNGLAHAQNYIIFNKVAETNVRNRS
jgi:hypothetical protein